MATPADNLELCVKALESAQASINVIKLEIGTVVSELSKIDMTIKVAANGLYQQLAKVNNNIISSARNTASKQSVSISNIEQRASEISSYMALSQSSLASIESDSSNSMIALTAISQNVSNLSSIAMSGLSNISSGISSVNANLLTLISNTASLASGSGYINIAPIVSELQNVANLIIDLDSTLVMVGNNIVSQIQMSGSNAATTGAILSELTYQSALLENISKSLLDIQSVLWKSLKASNMNFNNLADSDCCEKLLAAINKLISGKNKGGEGDNEREARSGISSLLESFKGGIFTAVVGFSKAISKPVAGIIDIFKKAISGEKIDYGQIFMSVAKSLEGIPNAFMSITNFASKFVAMLDPALMGQLALAFQDLMAVVGMGLRPVIQAAIPIVRAFADALVPIMQTLAPVINQFGNAMVKIAIPVIALWAKAIWALIPVFESIAPIFFDIAEIFSIGAPIISMAFDALSTSLQIVVGVVHLFMTAIKIVTVAIMDAAEWVVSWVSKSKADSIRAASEAVAESAARSGQEFKKIVDGLIEGPKPMPVGGQGGSFGAAAKQASYSGIADLGKNMMQAAFGQSQQNAALQTANNTKIMADGIGKMVGWFLGQGNENRPQQGVR